MSQSHKTALANPLAARLRSGELGLALMIKHARTVDIALAAKTCGFDALYFDLQHSTVPEDVVAQISAAAVQTGITPIARIPKGGWGTALRLLDGGALGIVVPDLVTADDAREAVMNCKFSPLGERSNAGRYPQFAYQAVPAVEARKALDENTLLIAMVETAAALENVEAIAAVPGIDVVHIGSSDLSSDLGYPGQNTHPKVLEAIERVVAACRANGKVPGMGGLSGGDPKHYELAIGLGARFFSAANEWSLMMSAGEERVRMLRGLSGAGNVGLSG
jgi:2-keto-3-deoxy-L-rhamnonate aldolase RhmA